MHPVFVSSALWLLFLPAQSTFPTATGPLRNTFAVAAETVIDNAIAVDVKAEDSIFTAQLQHLKVSENNLTSMASDAREKDIAASANNMLFMLSACHVQAKDGADTTKCESQLNHARTSMMEAIEKHKAAGAWADGPPLH